ncbi:hypothetical protein [Methylomonas rhizoryzae]|uniref:hypothetical protein n=1 Tax=Methylomonas rhizoryzae TaxID=2608981 RepID=UPI00123206E8|nr:hypothetical protein [Methylomonas rhizoryzae]
MAKEVFMTQWFTDAMRLAGESLVKKLDESGVQVAAAFWIQDVEEKNWELTIVSPLVGSEGPRSLYKRINDIYEACSDDEDVISLHDIRVSSIHNRIVNAMRNSVLAGAQLANNRMGRNYIDGIYIEDMYLYKIDWDMLAKLNDLNRVA